ncbi:MAG TPA: efflux RND transporter periplasmic adaptor subunit [Chthonomonadaceae bacterium]|nr:efflux RND transporter periplasmic adaptor subunit [Chthonomonadaceae bacterium]
MIDPDSRRNLSIISKPPRSGALSRGGRWTLCLLALALGAAGLAGCRGGAPEEKGGDTGGKSSGTAANATETTVEVTPAATRAVSAGTSITGALTAEKDVIVGTKSAGKVAEVRMREGDRVSLNQIVAVMDTADLKIQLRQQESNLASAVSRLDQAVATLRSAKQNQTLSAALDTFAVTQAKAGLDSAQAARQAVDTGARPEERVQARKSLEAAQRDQDSADQDLKSAQLDLQWAQDEFQRNTTLHKQGAISDQQYLQKEIAEKSAANRVQAAETRLNATKARAEVTAQALRLIENGSRQEDRDKAEAAVRQARATYDSALSTKQVQTTLRQNDIDNAVAGKVGAEEGIKLAQAQIDQTKQALDDSIIRSPINGYVAERKVEPGMQLASAKDIMRIVDTDSVYFDGQLSESQFVQVKPGQSVDVTVDALPGRTLKGRVARIYPVASSTARSFTAHIKLLNPGDSVRPQMFGRGLVTLDTHPNAIVVPKDALKNTVADVGGKTTANVYVVDPRPGSGGKEGGVVSEHQVQVETNYKTETEIEIVGDVKAGQIVVRDAAKYALKTGDTVAFTREKTQTASTQ